MQEYRFEHQAANNKWPKLDLAFGVTVALAAVAVLSLTTDCFRSLGISRDLLEFIAIVAALGACVGVYVLAYREAMRFAGRQMIFILKNDEIIRKRKGFPDSKIAFADVDSLREEMGWLVIRSRDQQEKIIIPNDLNGYQVIRSELLKHISLSPPAEFNWRGPFVALLSILSWAAVLWLHETWVAILAGLVALMTLVLASNRLWHILHERKRVLLWCTLAVVWSTAILIIYIRAIQR